MISCNFVNDLFSPLNILFENRARHPITRFFICETPYHVLVFDWLGHFTFSMSGSGHDLSKHGSVGAYKRT
jgi:hypothetical protein